MNIDRINEKDTKRDSCFDMEKKKKIARSDEVCGKEKERKKSSHSLIDLPKQPSMTIAS